MARLYWQNDVNHWCPESLGQRLRRKRVKNNNCNKNDSYLSLINIDKSEEPGTDGKSWKLKPMIFLIRL